MLVFHDVKLAYIAVPKTASTALHAALSDRAGLVVREPANLKHSPVRKFDRMIRPYLGSVGLHGIELFAMVRHPVSWLGSWFAYRQRPALKGSPQSTADVSFDDFVRSYCDDTPAPYANVGSPVWFLGREDGGIGIDHLFQYEQMPMALEFLSDRLGMEVKLPRVKISPEADLTLGKGATALLEQTRFGFFNLWERAGR